MSGHKVVSSYLNDSQALDTLKVAISEASTWRFDFFVVADMSVSRKSERSAFKNVAVALDAKSEVDIHNEVAKEFLQNLCREVFLPGLEKLALASRIYYYSVALSPLLGNGS